MITDAVPTPTPAEGVGSADDDELDHVYCCDPDRGLCGADLSDVADVVDNWDNGDADVCRVCVELERGGVPCCATCPKAAGGRI
ncbi:hypothetical protein [Streptomyces sp. NPDC005322]|uniref:hypothetical protein n=1 Tax=Streptomyces sp. NPDC005322 TaxID=3157032 RepID=UPI0033AD2D55